MLALSNNLVDKGVYKLQIDFSGSGDDGDIDEISFLDTEENEVEDIPYDRELLNKLENFFYAEINKRVHRVGDWVNNEGGYGTLYYYPETKQVKVDYYQRTTEDHSFPDEPLFV